MYDPVLGRFNSVDPLADQQSSLTPYHYSYNNPILFNDPTGLIGEYYYQAGDEIFYLGNDGEDDGKQYMVNDLGKFSSAKSANNGLNSGTTQTLLESGGAKEIEVQIPGGQSEGDFFKGIFDKGNADTEAKMKEQNATLIFDEENGVLTVNLNSDEFADARYSFGQTKEQVSEANSNHRKIGVAHTHQVADLDGPSGRLASTHTGDGRSAAVSGLPVYSIDSQGVLKHTPTTSVKGPTSTGSRAAQTSSLYNGRFSILKNALRTIATDRSQN